MHLLCHLTQFVAREPRTFAYLRGSCPTLLLTHLPASPVQSMARKLRIFPGGRHDFEGHPQLLPFTMPPRKLRVKGQLFELPDGFEPFNPQVGRPGTGRGGPGSQHCAPTPNTADALMSRHYATRAPRSLPQAYQKKYGHRLGKAAQAAAEGAQQQQQQEGS